MSPIITSAQFAAYIWYTGQPQNLGKSADEARQFAYEKWPSFLRFAHPGVGRLLLKLAGAPSARRRKRRARRAARSLAGHAAAALAARQPKPSPSLHTPAAQPFSSN
jgi:hypothetical protein